MPAAPDRRSKELPADELQQVRQLAKLAQELHCEVTLGHITVRPIDSEPAGQQARGLLAALKAPVLAFFERL